MLRLRSPAMLAVLAVSAVSVLAAAAFSLNYFAGRKIDDPVVAQVDSIRDYYESGGEEADQNIRQVVGFCASRAAGGLLPYAFRQALADAFVFGLSELDEKSANAGNLLEAYFNQHQEGLDGFAQGLDVSPEEGRLMERANEAIQKDPRLLATCVHEQTRERGWLPEAET